MTSFWKTHGLAMISKTCEPFHQQTSVRVIHCFPFWRSSAGSSKQRLQSDWSSKTPSQEGVFYLFFWGGLVHSGEGNEPGPPVGVVRGPPWASKNLRGYFHGHPGPPCCEDPGLTGG